MPLIERTRSVNRDRVWWGNRWCWTCLACGARMNTKQYDCCGVCRRSGTMTARDQEKIAGRRESYAATVARVRELRPAQRAALALEEFRRDGCHFCQESDPACLDAHHVIAGMKRHTVSQLARTGNLAALREELSNCLCVCANCHRKIHAGKIDMTEIRARYGFNVPV